MPQADPIFFDLFQRLALALSIGFLVGVERGWKHRDDADETRVAGLRTHAIIGLLGGVSGIIGAHSGPAVLAALVIAFIIPFAAFKYLETKRDGDISVTGAIAGLLVFALGIYCAEGDLRVAAAVGVALTGLLAFKEALHDWLEGLTWEEIRSALLILAASLIALPLLPDRHIDPWQAINPRELWLLTILVAGASFAGYVAVRLLGDRVGLMAGAAAGALVSSTVVTVDLARRVRDGSAPAPAAAAGACIAATVSLTRVCILIGVASAPALARAGPALAAGAIAFLASAFVLWRFAGEAKHGDAKITNPLEIKEVLTFAGLLALVIIIGRIASLNFGEAGLLPFAATAGIADVDAVALAAGSLIRGGVDPSAAAHAILVAVAVNTVSKGVMGAIAGGPRFAMLYFAAAGAAALIAALVWLFVAGAPSAMLGEELALPNNPR